MDFVESETNALTVQADPATTTQEVPKPVNPIGMTSPYELKESEARTAMERTRMILQVPWRAADVASVYTMDNVAAPMFDTGMDGAFNNPGARLSSAYRFFSGDLVLEVYTQGNRNCTGAVICASRVDHNTVEEHWGNITTTPYVIVRAQSDKRMRFVIPRVYPWPMKRDLLDRGWGKLHFYVQSPLTSCQSVTPPDMLICVEAHWENVVFTGASTHKYEFDQPRMRKVGGYERQSLIAEAVSMAKIGFTALKKAPKVLKSIGSVLDSIFDGGHSQPMDVAQPVRQVQFRPNAWNTTGPFMGSSLDTGTFAPTNPVEGVKDYSDFRDFLDHYCQIFQSSFSTGDQPGISYLTIPNDPAYGRTDSSIESWTVQNDRIRYLSTRFSLWRGDIKYKILFYVPQGCKATFLISHLAEVDPLESEVANMGDKPGITLTVDGDREVDLLALYQGLTPYKVCNPTPELPSTDRTAAGSINIQLLSYVVSSFNVATKINVVVMRASDNLEFYGPRKLSGYTFQSSEEIVYADEAPKLVTTNGTNRSTDLPFYGPRWRVNSFAELFRIWTVSNSMTNLRYLPEEATLFAFTRGGWRFGEMLLEPKHRSLNDIVPLSLGLSPTLVQSNFNEVPYSANVAYVPNVIKEEGYYLDNVITAQYTGSSGPANTYVYYRNDGTQYFYPAILPSMVKPRPPTQAASSRPSEPAPPVPVPKDDDFGLALDSQQIAQYFKEQKRARVPNSVLVGKDSGNDKPNQSPK